MYLNLLPDPNVAVVLPLLVLEVQLVEEGGEEAVDHVRGEQLIEETLVVCA